MFKLWQQVLTKPAETFKAEKGKASFLEALKHITVAWVALAVVFFVLSVAFSGALSSIMQGPAPEQPTNLSAEDLEKYTGTSDIGRFFGTPSMEPIAPEPTIYFGGLIVLCILLWAGMLFSALIQSGLFFALAKIFGGKAEFKQLFYLVSISIASLAPIIIAGTLVLALLVFYPIAIWVWMPLFLLLILGYSIVLLTFAIREATGFTTAKSFAVWLVSYIIMAIANVGLALI